MHQRKNLENQKKIFDKSLDGDDKLSKYNAIKNELDAICDNITEGIRSKCEWNEHREKSKKN